MLISYKQLLIWQRAVDFAVDIYQITKTFPKSELFGITSQLRSAAIAIPSNIAEGYTRGHRREYLQFLKIAYASGAESETQLVIAYRVGFLSDLEYQKFSKQLDEITRMIYSIIRKLS